MLWAQELKKNWYEMTFGGKDGKGTGKGTDLLDYAEPNFLIEDFGQTLIDVTKPIWRTQAAFLKKAPWILDERTHTHGHQRRNSEGSEAAVGTIAARCYTMSDSLEEDISSRATLCHCQEQHQKQCRY